MQWKQYFRLAAATQLLPVMENGEETTLIGGQAVMEGVMMRAPHSYCVAVRQHDGQIITQEGYLERLSEKYPIFKLPVLRGIGTLGHALWLGVKVMNFSAQTALPPDEKTGEKTVIPDWMMKLNIVFSIVFALVLYKGLPLLITTSLKPVVPALSNLIFFNFVDGLIRIGILVGLMWLLSKSKEMRGLFEFHGGEHKVVFNFESGKPVTVENAQKFVTWHPRCGTSFLMTLMFLSMLIYMFLPFENVWVKLAARVVLTLPIVGLSYEVIRFAARKQGSAMALVTQPGMWLQRITTQPPSDEQTAIAIQALQGAMELERKQGGRAVLA